MIFDFTIHLVRHLRWRLKSVLNGELARLKLLEKKVWKWCIFGYWPFIKYPKESCIYSWKAQINTILILLHNFLLSSKINIFCSSVFASIVVVVIVSAAGALAHVPTNSAIVNNFRLNYLEWMTSFSVLLTLFFRDLHFSFKLSPFDNFRLSKSKLVRSEMWSKV